MKELIELIKRLEVAAEGSPDLDREIMDFVGWKIDPSAFFETIYESPDGGRISNRQYPFPYTRSIDAAMTLIPTHSHLERLGVFTCLTTEEKPLWQATVWRPLISPFERREELHRVGSSLCASAPVALCIAALRARSGG